MKIHKDVEGNDVVKLTDVTAALSEFYTLAVRCEHVRKRRNFSANDAYAIMEEVFGFNSSIPEDRIQRLKEACEQLRPDEMRKFILDTIGPFMVNLGWSIFWGTEEDGNHFVEFHDGESDFAIMIHELVI
jgi:hypothetical protein